MADDCFAHPRLAAIYDPLDPDRSDLDPYLRMAEEFEAQRVLDIGCGTGHRINHGGHRQLNAPIYRTVIVRMRFHQPTIDYVTRRTAEGKTKREIIRCLKRYVIREVYHLIRPAPRTLPTAS